MTFLRNTYKTNGHQYAIHICDFCSREYGTRVRDRKHDNCGCTPQALKHGNERGRKTTPELKTYRKLKERCLSPACKDYINYGGRGITVCDTWLQSFETFLADMGPRPSPKHSIERLDVNGPYSKGNCVWTTKHEQARNTRANVYVEISGERKIITDWLTELGIAKTVYYRSLRHSGDHVETLRECAKRKGIIL